MDVNEKTNQIMKWIDKRNSIKAEKQNVINKLSMMGSPPYLDAKARLDSFIYQNGGVESAIPFSLKGELESLKSEYEKIKGQRDAYFEKHKDLKSRLDELDKNFLKLEKLEWVDSPTAGGIESFAAEATFHTLDEIKCLSDMLNKLSLKREKLQEHINGYPVVAQGLDEKFLAESEIHELTKAIGSHKQAQHGKEADEELLLQINQAIEGIIKKIGENQKLLVSNLSDAVNAYTAKARKVFFQKFKEILEADNAYYQCVCHVVGTLGTAVFKIPGIPVHREAKAKLEAVLMGGNANLIQNLQLSRLIQREFLPDKL